MGEVRVLMIGDVVGKPGRRAVELTLPHLLYHEKLDLVIANGENAAGGLGITPELATDLFTLGIDIITSGNHIYKRPQIVPFMKKENHLIRPANYAAGEPGFGSVLIETAGHVFAVFNLEGTVFMKNLENPFQVADRLVLGFREKTPLIFLDFHAEATSEKIAMGYHLDGRVTAVFGTHTHVQTADARVLAGGTAFITDVGMTGPVESVIGVTVKSSLTRFVTGQSQHYATAKGPARMDGCIVTADAETGKAVSIKPLRINVEE